MAGNDSCAVADIIVRDRARKSIGNILGLCESIGRLGLLHPLVLNGRRELIAGGRRLAAVKRLGWETVPVRVVESLDDAVAAMQAERDENNCREDLTPTEIVEIGRAIEALEKPKAKDRKTAGTNQHTEPSGKLPEGSKGDTRDKVGAALGVSGKTYEKAKEVVEAAEAEPEKFGDLPAKMDAESVHAAHEELKQRQEPEREPDCTPIDLSQYAPAAPEREYPKRRPEWMKPGNHTDPDHPFADVLKQMTALTKAMNKAIANDQTGKLREYLSYLSKFKFKVLMVAHTGAAFKDGKSVPAMAKFVGLHPLRGIVRLAGKDKRKRTPEQVIKEFSEAAGADPQDILAQEDGE